MRGTLWSDSDAGAVGAVGDRVLGPAVPRAGGVDEAPGDQYRFRALLGQPPLRLLHRPHWRGGEEWLHCGGESLAGLVPGLELWMACA